MNATLISGLNREQIQVQIMLHQNVHASGGIEKLRVKELFLSILHQVLISCRNRENDFFNKYTGFRPIDYVFNYRMERSSDLLKAGNFSIHDIAVSVGYTNPLYFSRLFFKNFGVSPSAYTHKLGNHIY